MPEFRHIVRVCGIDIEGGKKVIAGVASIKGVGWAMAHAIVGMLRIDPKLRIGDLSDEQVSAIERAIRDPRSIRIPGWMLNRRRDLETGEDRHLITADWDFSVRMDIEREKSVQSWRGVRHALGLKVRGQRTRTTGRKGPAVGVRKKAR